LHSGEQRLDAISDAISGATLGANSGKAEARHRAHDLLWLGGGATLMSHGPTPAWATAAWLRATPVVVRRGMPGSDNLPVGVRGATRSERWACRLASCHIVRSVTPEQIARRVTLEPGEIAGSIRCLQTLVRLAPDLNGLPLTWGVAGSVGFTLASGLNVLRPDSDLDLLVRAPDREDQHALRSLGELLGDAPHVDVQVDTAIGAFALKEWLRTGGPVLLKTDHGPMLCEDAWQATEPTATPGTS
jgi:phosphoribosyl-dephospho-CoA transferase